jgi:hypothetical protein
MFKVKFNLQDNTKLPVLFAVCCLAVLALSFSRRDDQRLSTAITLLGTVGGMIVFFYVQQARDIQLFRELFREFNERYGKLNDRLNEICNSDRDLTGSERRVLCAYFDLCAEEYIYFAAGYIDSRVWYAWVEGMRYFARHYQIRNFWEDELKKQKSYYGFTLDCICNRNCPLVKVDRPCALTGTITCALKATTQKANGEDGSKITGLAPATEGVKT